MGKRPIFLGDAGAGAVMKPGVNALIHGLNQTLAEALAQLRDAEACGYGPRDMAAMCDYVRKVPQ
jgi:3-hydroxyisobutyrate dehydrogenase